MVKIEGSVRCVRGEVEGNRFRQGWWQAMGRKLSFVQGWLGSWTAVSQGLTWSDLPFRKISLPLPFFPSQTEYSRRLQ